MTAEEKQAQREYILTMKLKVPASMREEGVRRYIHSQIFRVGWSEAFQTNYIHSDDFRLTCPHTSTAPASTVFFFGIPLILSADLIDKAVQLENAIQEHDRTIIAEALKNLAHSTHKEVEKWRDEDPLMMAYVAGQKSMECDPRGCLYVEQAKAEERELLLSEFKWMRPICFGQREAICDTRCSWAVRERCIQSRSTTNPARTDTGGE